MSEQDWRVSGYADLEAEVERLRAARQYAYDEAARLRQAFQEAWAERNEARDRLADALDERDRSRRWAVALEQELAATNAAHDRYVAEVQQIIEGLS